MVTDNALINTSQSLKFAPKFYISLSDFLFLALKFSYEKNPSGF